MEVVGIKFKNSSKVYFFSPNGLALKSGDHVVVETPSGNVVATVSVVKQIDPADLVAPLENVIRVATKNDLAAIKKNEEKRETILTTSKNLIEKYKLDMKLVDAEVTLDGQKIVITYVCEDRVDFRDLVKELASALKSRIELKQIGTRDQAKVVGALGACGQEACCARYLNNFDKVSIKMAKTQNLSLNPTKISGVCGRLMCCLSFENEGYADNQKYLPRVGTKVSTPDGSGNVVYNNILKKTTDVRLEVEGYVIKTYTPDQLKYQGKVVEQVAPNTTNFVYESDAKNPNSEFYVEFTKKQGCGCGGGCNSCDKKQAMQHGVKPANANFNSNVNNSNFNKVSTNNGVAANSENAKSDNNNSNVNTNNNQGKDGGSDQKRSNNFKRKKKRRFGNKK